MMDCPLSVAGIAIENGRVFIARRNGEGDMAFRWEFPGGKAEKGESAEQALVREFDEEFSISVSAGPFIGETKFTHRGIIRRLAAYRVYLPAPAPRLSVHTAWRWASLEEIAGLPFTDSDRALVPFLKSYLDNNR